MRPEALRMLGGGLVLPQGALLCHGSLMGAQVLSMLRRGLVDPKVLRVLVPKES